MRIIGGRASGIQLSCTKHPSLRPTTDRVKESMFARLGNIRGLIVVDLFSGSGALGLEALSREAGSVYFFEENRKYCDLIHENLTKVAKAMSTVGGTKIIRADALNVATILSTVKADLIIADPPYFPDEKIKGAEDLLCNKDIAVWAGDALLVLEQSVHSDFLIQSDLCWEVESH
ncbi:RsmD family RNA methyltransferase, partial [bacterium AH-315-E10]|nr:RsmD family RNA methyltransferase [bacterium AH-315-E10]